MMYQLIDASDISLIGNIKDQILPNFSLEYIKWSTRNVVIVSQLTVMLISNNNLEKQKHWKQINCVITKFN